MKIIVLNGSPSGERGTSAQYVAYLQRVLPEHSFHTIEVARQPRRLEQDEARFVSVVQQMSEADAIVWCFPVYFMLVPAQLKRFIELLFERVDPSALAGKPATSITTSAHFYDHTAHDYMHAVSVDLGLAYVRGFSAGMEDLLAGEGRRNLLGFTRDFLEQARRGETPVDAGPPPVAWRPPDLSSQPLPPPLPKDGGLRVVVITDAGPQDANLLQMIELLDRSLRHRVDRLSLNELRIDGGCLGCLRCIDGGTCGYRDEYAAAFEGRVKPADVVIYAAKVRDRHLSARFKAFIDRYFSNGHRPVLRAGLVGYLVSGPLSQLPTLRETIEATIEVGPCHRLGVVSDDDPDPAAVVRRVSSMGRAVDRWVADPWTAPSNFLGVGGRKIFRDLVYANKGVLSEDHRFYSANGLYDFPQADLPRRLFNEILFACKRVPYLRQRAEKAVLSGKLRRFQREIERASAV